MAAIELRTLADIFAAVQEELKLNASDTVTRDRIKRDINTVYQDDVCAETVWDWARGFARVTLQPYTALTVTATQNSDVITVTSGPTSSVREYLFAFDGSTDIYTIRAHAAGSTTMQLDAPFAAASQTAGSGRVWQQRLALPPDCTQIIQATTPFMETPMEGLGLMQMRRYIVANPKLEGRPQFYSTQGPTESAEYGAIGGLPAVVSRASARNVKTIVFASTVAALITEGDRIRVTGAGQFSYNGDAPVISVSTTTITYAAKANYDETTTGDVNISVTLLSNRKQVEEFRQMIVHPAISTERITISVDYKRRVPSLNNDTDEPWMPIEDRSVLKYGALFLAWSRERNPEEALRNYKMFEAKLMKMKGRLNSSKDMPRFEVSSTYIEAKRRRHSRYRWRRF